jgi:CheY-like chemotaxis protein
MRKRILVIDNDILVTEIVQAILDSTGLYEVETATDPFDALERVRARRFDLLISYFQMPGMTGDKLQECAGSNPIDEIELLLRPKILLMSAHPDDRVVELTLVFPGEASFIEKPFSARSLIRSVDLLLRDNDDHHPVELDLLAV